MQSRRAWPILARFARERGPGIVVAVLMTIVGFTLAHDRLFHRPASAEPHEPAAEAPGRPAPEGRGLDPASTVALAEAKYLAAGIEVGPVRRESVAREVSVAGGIEPDATLRVEVRPRAAGVVRTVPALPGTRVKAGDVLVVLESPDVASARLLLRERQRGLTVARAEASWKSQVADNTEAMIGKLRQGASAQSLDKQFADRPVGNARGTLIAAWAEVELATHELIKQSDLNKQKIVGEHPVFVAEHNVEGAHAKFEAALEQVRFDVGQQDRVARQMARNAEEMVVDAAQRLKILGVDADVADLVAHPESASNLPLDGPDLARYPILAPLDGVVVSTSTARDQQVDPAHLLFVVADLSRVYAVANVPESDFADLPALVGGRVRLAAKAYPGRTFDARMLYVGSEVDPTTRTVRLVAQADNPGDLLKLGMFARIDLDARSTETVDVVPPSAVVEFDGEPAVFVPDPDPARPRTFTKHAVKLGRAVPEGQVIVGGLKAGDRLATRGAFVLKSELILQNQGDED